MNDIEKNKKFRLSPKQCLRSSVSLLLTASLVWSGVALGQPARGMPEDFVWEPRDLSLELANKMTGTYTVAAVGDVLIQEPMAKMMSPELLDILCSADTTVGNLESYIVDEIMWPHRFGNNVAPKSQAQDYADMCFDMLASGEGGDGPESMISSIRLLDEVGIKVAGYGPNLNTARRPVFQHLKQGRAGLLVAYPVPDRGAGSGDEIARGSAGDGFSGGSAWGLNPLRLTVWHTVTPDQMRDLKGIRDSIVARRNEPDVSRPIQVPRDEPDRVQLFADMRFMVGPEVGEYRYEMNEQDRRGNILSMRQGKQYADFMMFSMHVHQNRYAFQAYSNDNYPPQYLIDLAREMVDNGMDMYVGHGNHTMQGIEIYKGRPIFYNLGNLSVHRWGYDHFDFSSPSTWPRTRMEAGEESSQWLQGPANQRAYIAHVRYEEGYLEEIKIYPVDLGGAPGPERRTWSRTDIPMTPSPNLAREILEEIQEYSEPFGTNISIETDEIGRVIGVIRIPKSATEPIAVGLRESWSQQ